VKDAITWRRSQDVLVNDATQTITAQNMSGIAFRHGWNWPLGLRWHERQRSMWPVPVVIIDEHFNDRLRVRLI